MSAFIIYLFSLFMIGGNQKLLLMSGTLMTKTQKEIVWDTASLKRIAPPDSSAFYPRMIQLMNSSLFAIYASNGNVVGVTSNDNGQDWSSPKLIAAKRDKVNMDTPDLMQLKNGTLLACYATRPQGALRGNPDPLQKFEIRIQKSVDNGQSWQDEKTLYQAGSSFKDGCWEPSLVQLPSGEIQLFFANEAVYTSSNEQNISMLQSFDNGKSWSPTPRIISFRKGSRDGMPVPIWINNEKKVVVAIEDPGIQNFKPYTVRSSINGKWLNIVEGDHPDRNYALVNPIIDSVYVGAPYLRQLSTGETVLSYQSTEGRIRNRENNAVMRVAVGDQFAKNFHSVSTPFLIPEGYNALWNSLCILKDDSIIALTSTNGFSKRRTEVWMIKGKLNKN